MEPIGAILIADPFAGTAFAELRQPTGRQTNFDARGMKSVAYDLGCYLRRLGPDSALKTFEDFARATAAEDAFAAGGVLSFLDALPDFRTAMADPIRPSCPISSP